MKNLKCPSCGGKKYTIIELQVWQADIHNSFSTAISAHTLTKSGVTAISCNNCGRSDFPSEFYKNIEFIGS